MKWSRASIQDTSSFISQQFTHSVCLQRKQPTDDYDAIIAVQIRQFK